MREEIIEILEELRPDVDFDQEAGLVDKGYIESFDLIEIIAQIEDKYNITVNAGDLTVENFNSVDAIVELVKRCQNG